MSRFYGSLNGARGESTKTGTTNSGIQSHARGWNIGVKTNVYDHDGQDYVSIGITGGSHNGSVTLDLGTFKLVDGKPVKVS